MLRAIIVSVVIFFLTLPAFGQITSPPADNLITQLLEEGWVPGDIPRLLLAKEMAIKSERLSRSGVDVYETTKKFKGDGPASPEIKSYFAVIVVPGIGPSGEDVALSRQLNPEERARLKGDTIAPRETMAVGLQAYGEGLLLVGGTLSQMVRDSGMGPAIGGDGGRAAVNQSGATALNPRSVSNSAGCELALDTLSGVDVPGLSALPVNSWESVDPFFFLLGPACMVIKVAERMGVDLDTTAAEMLAAQQAGFEFANMQDVVEDMVGNRAAQKIVAEGLSFSQPMSSLERDDTDSLYETPAPPSERFANKGPGKPHSLTLASSNSASFAPLSMSQSGTQVVAANTASGMLTINKMSVWIDAEYFVRLKMRMEGVIEQDGESREIFLEQQYMDYQTVPGTFLYEPYREVMRVGGLISPEQQAELQEAARKLDEYEQQLASLPASQRAMMESMMGSKIDQFRNMASGGAMEMELITTNFVINPDLGNPIPEGESLLEKSSLVQMIQEHLETLGYDPGKTDGDLIKQTVVAITQFEANNGMPVTGQATPQLAGILAAAVDAAR